MILTLYRAGALMNPLAVKEFLKQARISTLNRINCSTRLFTRKAIGLLTELSEKLIIKNSRKTSATPKQKKTYSQE
jgi:hypothetical protein